MQASGWGPVVGDGAGSRTGSASCSPSSYRVVVAADGDGSAARLREPAARARASTSPIVEPAATDLDAARRADRRRPAAPRRARCPTAKVAVVAESDLTGRRRAHRRPAARSRDRRGRLRGPQAGQLRRALPARRRPLRGHGQAHDRRHRARLPARSPTRAATSSTCPSDQIDTLRQYVGGEAPTLHRLGGRDFAKAKSRVRSAVREIAQELVVLYQKRVNAEGYAFGQRHAVAARDGGGLPVRRDARPAHGDRRRQGRHGAARTRWTAWCAATSGSARPRSRSGPRSRRSRTASRSPCSRRRRCSPRSTATRSPTASPATRSGSRCSAASSPTPRPREVVDGLASGEVDCVIGTHRLLSEGVQVQGPRPARRRRGAALRRAAQGGDEEAQDERRRAHADRHADPAHARDEPRRDPRPVAASTRRPPTASRSSPTSAGTTSGSRSRRSGASCSARVRCSGCTTACSSIDHAAARLRELVPEARIAVAHGQMDEGTLEQVVVDFWEGRYDVLVCTTIIESGIDMPTVNTLVVERADLLGLGQLHQLRGRVGRSGQRGLRLPVPPAGRGADRGGVRAAEDDRRGDRARQRLQDRDARPRDPRRRQPARRGAVRPHRRRRLRPLLPDGHRGGGRDEGRDARRSSARSSSTSRPTPTCPHDYVAKEESRLEAYRRLAAVTDAGRGRRHPRRVGGPLRAGPGGRPSRCSRSPGCAPSATASACATCTIRPATRAARLASRRSSSS